jgi:outer membrane protein assembly factor BamD
MSQKIFAALAVCAFLFGAAACGSKKAEISPQLASSDETLFKEGEKYLKKDAEKARLYMRQIIDSFPKSYYAQRAKLAVADTYFDEGDEGNMILAAAEYREFIQLFPYSPAASYAQFRIALSFFDKSLKAGRDQQKTQQALAEFKKVLTNYPLSEEAKQTRAKIKDCEERLAEHAYLIGEQYYRTTAFKASTSRLTEILTTYPTFSGMDKVYFTLGASFQEWGKADQAIPYFTKLTTDFPKSPLAVKAQDRLKEAQKQAVAQAAVQAAAKAPEKKK